MDEISSTLSILLGQALADFGRDPSSSDSLISRRNFVFCPVNNARFHRFTVGQILRHLNTIGVAIKTFGTLLSPFCLYFFLVCLFVHLCALLPYWTCLFVKKVTERLKTTDKSIKKLKKVQHKQLWQTINPKLLVQSINSHMPPAKHTTQAVIGRITVTLFGE